MNNENKNKGKVKMPLDRWYAYYLDSEFKGDDKLSKNIYLFEDGSEQVVNMVLINKLEELPKNMILLQPMAVKWIKTLN